MTVPRLPSVICPFFPGDPIGDETVLTPFIRPPFRPRPGSEGGFAEKRVAFHRLSSLRPSPPSSDVRPSVRRPFHPSVRPSPVK